MTNQLNRPGFKRYLMNNNPVFISYHHAITETESNQLVFYVDTDTITTTNPNQTPLTVHEHDNNHIEFTNGLYVSLIPYNHGTRYYHRDNMVYIVEKKYDTTTEDYRYNVTIFKIKEV